MQTQLHTCTRTGSNIGGSLSQSSVNYADCAKEGMPTPTRTPPNPSLFHEKLKVVFYTITTPDAYASCHICTPKRDAPSKRERYPASPPLRANQERNQCKASSHSAGPS